MKCKQRLIKLCTDEELQKFQGMVESEYDKIPYFKEIIEKLKKNIQRDKA